MALKDSFGNKMISTYGQKYRCVFVYNYEDATEYYHTGTIIECLGGGRFSNHIEENDCSGIKTSECLSGVNGRWEPVIEIFTEKLEDYM